MSEGIRGFNCVGEGEVSHHSVKKTIAAGQNLRTGLPHASSSWVLIVVLHSDKTECSGE